MKQTRSTITDLAAAVQFVRETMAAHPERNGLEARMAAYTGRPRRYSGLSIGHLGVPGDTDTAPREFETPKVDMRQTPEGRLARELVNLLEPLDLLNPVNPVLGLGKGTGTMVTAFGIPLDESCGNAPAFTRALSEVLGDPPPDPATAGLMPDMLARIDFIQAHLPPFFKISLPDMQGPFNLAHAVLGEEALTAPCLRPGEFRAFMDRLTDLWLETRRLLLEHIGPHYRNPLDDTPLVAECSVNLVSPEFYIEDVLPHDRRIAALTGRVRIHTCSGPHVFRVTLERLPVVETEAGRIERTAAGYTPIADALAAVCGRPILLNIGQEIYDEDAFELIRHDLDLYRRSPRLTFGYTGMNWRRRDRPQIRHLHRRLDEYWAAHCAGACGGPDST